ncbi:GHMP family kinase ATP-binding protein [Asticcacaulis machinosus]|uniref:Kinase n=1 Tax=Asticcacaulis machinosus TaxID=2984211 RepID=A0ABT5HLM9_9CAUL|nr:kinase [Asticcacaulis machinosus]MDC7676494.1 kinase [Asticcacaulis machinosus]
MIIVRTPLRVSFFGGGTDHPTWFNTGEKAAVLSTTIDKYIYVTLRRLPRVFDFNYRVAWRIIEETQSLSEIKHPIVRSVLEYYGQDDDSGYEVLYNADLPAQSGLGSSSAFTVSMLKAYMGNLHRLESKRYYAEQAIHIEQNLLKEPVGSQDQIAAAYGGLNRIDFKAGGDFHVEPVLIAGDRKRELNSRLMMFFTGFTRSASKIEGEKIKSFSDKTAELREMYQMVDEGMSILQNPSIDLSEFGRLLDRGWQAKRRLSQSVSTSDLDDAYEAAIKAGATGGKLLGAGGGGFLLFYVEPEYQSAVRFALSSMLNMRFGFEDHGSSVVLYNPDLTANYDFASRKA